MITKTIVAASLLLSSGASLVQSAPSFQLPFVGNGGNKAALHAPGEPIDLSRWTVGQILNYTLYHPGHHDHDHEHDHPRARGGGKDDGPRGPPLHKLAYVVNRTESIKEYLSDPNVSVTLFAPDDEALRPPPGHGPGHHDGPHHGPPGHHHDEDEESAAPRDHPFHLMAEDSPEHDEPTDEEKRRFIKKIVEAVLHYHISPSEIEYSELVDRQTIPSSLNQTKDLGVPFRIRSSSKFELLPPGVTTKLNFYAALRKAPAIKAKNGIIYLISAPLLPPLTPLDQLLAFPIPFSTLTSAVQQTELDSAIAPWLHHRHESKETGLSTFMSETIGDEAMIALEVLKEMAAEKLAALNLPNSDEYKYLPYTIFAPTNVAFAKIPFKIRTFLFSPFGRNILKKVLEYHVVPQYVFHTDYQLNATRGEKGAEEILAPFETEMMNFESANLKIADEATSLGSVADSILPHFPKLGGSDDGKDTQVDRYVLPTVFGSRKNESLHVNVYSYRSALGKGPLTKTIKVGNYEQSEEEYTQVWIGDGVAWGGAVHVVNSIIRPPMPHHHGEKGGDKEHRHPPHHHEHHGRPAEKQAEYFKALWA